MTEDFRLGWITITGKDALGRFAALSELI